MTHEAKIMQRSAAGRRIDEVRELLRQDYEKTHNWRLVAEHFGIKPGTANRIYKDQNYEPKDPQIRFLLGLALVAVVVVIEGRIPDGTQAQSASQCDCGQYYISNHPHRSHCFICSPYRGKKRKP